MSAAPNNKPHPITVVLALLALAVSGASSWLSYKALTLNREFNTIAQQPYLAIKNFAMTYDPKSSSNNPYDYYEFTADIYNGGNTPADEVVATLYPDASLTGSYDPNAKPFDRSIGFIGPKDTVRVQWYFGVEKPPPQLKDRAPVTLNGVLAYRDRLGDNTTNHKWCTYYYPNNTFRECGKLYKR